MYKENPATSLAFGIEDVYGMGTNIYIYIYV